jgi:hypothetical protein
MYIRSCGESSSSDEPKGHILKRPHVVRVEVNAPGASKCISRAWMMKCGHNLKMQCGKVS